MGAAAAIDERRDRFADRLSALFKDARERGLAAEDARPAAWFGALPLIDVSERQVQRYLSGDRAIPDRIFAAMDVIERQQGLEADGR